MKRKLIYLLIFLTLGIFATRKPIETIKDVKPINHILEEKMDYTEVITEKIKKINKREVMQINLRYKTTLKNDLQNKFFKNNKIITVNAVGIYKFDLDTDIIKNGDSYIVLANLETDIIETKATFEDDKGWFAFTDLKITPEEAEEIKNIIHNELIEEMWNDDNIKIVKERAEEVIRGDSKYTIDIRWLKW